MDAPVDEYDEESGDNINVLLVSANVGTLFEDPQRLLASWTATFLETVTERKPQFLALHLQEVGGKTYEKSLEYVQEFVKSLCEAPAMQDFEHVRVYLDEDHQSAAHFTALGNLYFIHKDLKNVQMWNFELHTWEEVNGSIIFSGNIETIANKDKAKFPQHFFPECKWSRKGFMRTKWQINKTVFELANIHLFHDASNLAACEEFPSVYCKTRRRALAHTLERFILDEENIFAPLFIFGDFNFRCDTEGVIRELTENLTTHRIQCESGKDSMKVCYRDEIGENILTVGKKEFFHANHQFKFKESWLKRFDRDLEPFVDFLWEFSIEFPPSYPYEEQPEMPKDYMTTRCPSWCDRILMSPQVIDIIDNVTDQKSYDIIGKDVCMGDHKPVFLNIFIKPNQGLRQFTTSLSAKLQDIINPIVETEIIWRKQYEMDDDGFIGGTLASRTSYVKIHSAAAVATAVAVANANRENNLEDDIESPDTLNLFKETSI